MNLKNLSKEVSAVHFKKGDALLKKNAARELEEVEKGKYIAFVDDGPDSYDVMLMMDKNFEIIDHSCDCEEKYFFCAHKVTVALHLKDRGKSTTDSVAKKIRAKKVDELRQFIDGISEDSIKDWLYNIAKTNKEVHHLLTSHFDKKTVELDEKIILEKSQSMAKAIMGKAKYYDASQVTKIINLWQPYHMEIVEEIMIDPLNMANYKMMLYLLSVIDDYKMWARKSTNKLNKYEQMLMEKVSLKTYELDDEKKGKFISLLVETYNRNIFRYDVFLTPILAHLSHIDQNVSHRIINEIISKLTANSLAKKLSDLMTALDDAGSLKSYIHLFNVLFAEPDYNVKLIKKLIQYGFSYEAEKMCNACIKVNRHIDYNKVYHEILVDIYKENNDDVAYHEQIKLLAPLTLDYSHYKAYMDYEKDEKERRAFEALMERKLSHCMGLPEYGAFIFQKLADNGEYEKMFHHISSSYPVAYYYPCIEELYNYDKELLLEKLLYMKYANYTFRTFKEEDVTLWNAILDKYYTKKKVQDKVNNTQSFTLMNVYIKAYLAKEEKS